MYIVEPPSAVDGLSVVKVTSDSITLTWTLADDGNSPVTSYIVYYTSGIVYLSTCILQYYIATT